MEALPLGNGRIGAMCFGRPGADLIKLNDDRGWSGSPANELEGGFPDAASAQADIAAARAAVAAGDYAAADEPLLRIQQKYTQSYMPFSDLHLTITAGDGAQDATDYRRELRLKDAMHEHSYLLGGHRITQSSYISAPAGVMVIEISTDHPDGLDLTLDLTTELLELDRAVDGGRLELIAQLPSNSAPGHESDLEQTRYDRTPGLAVIGGTFLRLLHDGGDRDGTGTVGASGVRRATVILTTATTFTSLGMPLLTTLDVPADDARKRIDAAEKLGSDRLLADHLADYRGLYSRAELHFDRGDDGTSHDDLPTGDRLALASASPAGALAFDPGLAATLFNFGRYLLIASSRAGTLPTNLQGIWNDLIQPPWSSNYTININTQMNYWPVEVANLAELHEPLFDLVDALAVRGRETAARIYGLPGWVAHHNTDPWAFSAPVGMGRGDTAWAYWPMSGPWLVSHLAQHLEFGAGDDFARDRAWPVAASAAAFMLGWLEADADGTLGTPVSTSPENHFITESGKRASVAASTTMDMSLIRELFETVVSLAKRLGIDSSTARACAAALPRLLPPQIGEDGRLLEYPHGLPDWEPHHRHVSHLYGLYPGAERWDADLTAAAKLSLDVRGGDSTGWSLAWKTCLRARLYQPEVAGDLLALFFREPQDGIAEWAGALYPNLFQSNPPFQIDANLGYIAAIAECLVQSHRGIIELLPALPPTLGSGNVRGLVARPGVEVDLEWKDGELVAAALTSRRSRTVAVHYRGSSVAVDLVEGVSQALEIARFASLESQPA
jgi:alpha-L-fucosidase 2